VSVSPGGTEPREPTPAGPWGPRGPGGTGGGEPTPRGPGGPRGPKGSGGKGFPPGSGGFPRGVRGDGSPRGRGVVPPGPTRQFALVLLLGAAGAGLVVFTVRQTWAQAIFTPPHPLPAQDISVTGQQLVPLASALALAGLACLAAVIATRSVARRVAGALLAVLGAGAAAAAAAGVQASTVLAAARAQAAVGALGGSTTSGTSPGGAVHVIVIAGSAGRAVMAAAPWRAAAVCGAVAMVLAGLATVWRGPRWPVMSARFDRSPGGFGGPRGVWGDGQSPQERGDPGGSPPRGHTVPPDDMWESLSRDLDPTVEGGTAPNLEDQLGGGTPA